MKAIWIALSLILLASSEQLDEFVSLNKEYIVGVDLEVMVVNTLEDPSCDLDLSNSKSEPISESSESSYLESSSIVYVANPYSADIDISDLIQTGENIPFLA